MSLCLPRYTIQGKQLPHPQSLSKPIISVLISHAIRCQPVWPTRRIIATIPPMTKVQLTKLLCPRRVWPYAQNSTLNLYQLSPRILGEGQRVGNQDNLIKLLNTVISNRLCKICTLRRTSILFRKKFSRRWDGWTKNGICYLITKTPLKLYQYWMGRFSRCDDHHRIVRAKILSNLKKERHISDLLKQPDIETNIKNLNDDTHTASSGSPGKYCPKTQKGKN